MYEAWLYFLQRPEVVGQWVLEHLWLIFVSNGVAVCIAVPLGIYISAEGRQRLADAVLYVASILMTIPSLALFGLLMPALAGMGLKSIGFLPAVIALILYGQLPILRNTYTAIRAVDPAMVEAGRGMGMSSAQILFRVKLPLAMPVIMAGLRNAVVLNIGITTIAAVIGAGGLGTPIFRGLRTGRMDLIIVGAVAVSLLALTADALLAAVEKGLTPRGIHVERTGSQA